MHFLWITFSCRLALLNILRSSTVYVNSLTKIQNINNFVLNHRSDELAHLCFSSLCPCVLGVHFYCVCARVVGVKPHE